MRLILFILSTFISFSIFAQGLPTAVKSKLDSVLFPVKRAENMPGFAVCIVQQGNIVYEGQTGMANIRQHLPIQHSTIFNIGSMAKQFTAMCIYLLEEEGKLNLADPIHKYLPELPDYGFPITIAHLMSHTSGIRDHIELLIMANQFKRKNLCIKTMLDYQTKVHSLNFSPGTDLSYCNTGYMMLAAIVERVSGQRIHDFAQQHIFMPLGMTSARFIDDYINEMPDGTLSYEYVSDKSTFKGVPKYRDALGATGVHCSIRDFALWEQNFFQNKLGKGGPKIIQRMETAFQCSDGNTSAYGGGLFIRNYRGYREIEHSGGWLYYMCQSRYYPELELSVIIMCNNTYDNPFVISENICKILLPDRMPIIHNGASTLDDNLLDSICGLYISQNNWIRHIKKSGKQLYITKSSAPNANRIYLNYVKSKPDTLFFTDSIGNKVNFTKVKQQINAMSWENGHYFLNKRNYEKMYYPQNPDLQQFKGKYRSKDIHKSIRIKYHKRKDQLIFIPFPFVKYRLNAITNNVFQIQGEDFLLRFQNNTFTLGDMWNRNLLFVR